MKAFADHVIRGLALSTRFCDCLKSFEARLLLSHRRPSTLTWLGNTTFQVSHFIPNAKRTSSLYTFWGNGYNLQGQLWYRNACRLGGLHRRYKIFGYPLVLHLSKAEYGSLNPKVSILQHDISIGNLTMNGDSANPFWLAFLD